MLRIFLSPLVVVLILLLISEVEKALFYLPLIFALSLSLVNFKKIKVRRVFGVLLSIVQSYAVFVGLAIVTLFADELLQNINLAENDSGFKGIVLVTLGGYLAALLLFYFYSFVFRVTNKRFSYILLSVCYGIIVLVMQIFSKNEFLQFGVEKFESFVISWVIFMSLAFSLAYNRDALMRFIDQRKK